MTPNLSPRQQSSKSLTSHSKNVLTVPRLKVEDRRYGAVTPGHAAAMYGVAIADDNGGLAVDAERTAALRAAIRADRLG